MGNKQKQLEQNFQNNKNFFYDSIKKNLSEASSSEKFVETLDKTIVDLYNPQTKELTLNQFTYIGGVAYLFGIDFSSQLYVTEDVINNVRKRFIDVFGSTFNQDVFMKIVKIVELLIDNKEVFEKTKTELVNKVNKPIQFKNDTEKHQFNILISSMKQLINKSIYAANIAVEIDSIFNKPVTEFTYQDLLKINTITHQNLSFTGAEVIKYIAIYGDTLYVHKLEKASELFDNQKFMIIYYDSILTLKEAFDKLFVGKHPSEVAECLNNIFNEPEDIKEIYVSYKNQYEASLPVVPVEEVKIETEHKPVDDIEIQQLLKENPDLAVLHILRDIVKDDKLTNQKVHDAIEYLFNDLDYASNLYHFFKSKLLSPLRTYDFGVDINYEELKKELKDKNKTMSDNYTDLIKKTCEEIPKSELEVIVGLVDKAIDSVLLENEEQKQFLISQKLDNGITTYNHVHQLLQLLENCKVIGTRAQDYVKLHNFVAKNEKMMGLIELSLTVETLTTQLRILTIIKDWFTNKNIDKDIFENTNPIQKPE